MFGIHIKLDRITVSGSRSYLFLLGIGDDDFATVLPEREGTIFSATCLPLI